MLPQINQLLRMPQPESQRFCQLPRQPLLHTSTATSQASQSTPVVNYTGIHPYHPVQTHPLAGNYWHSGFSPHKYEIMELPQKVKSVMDADLILLKSIGILRIPLLPDIAIEGSCEEMNELGLGSFSIVRTIATLITISTLAIFGGKTLCMTERCTLTL